MDHLIGVPFEFVSTRNVDWPVDRARAVCRAIGLICDQFRRGYERTQELVGFSSFAQLEHRDRRLQSSWGDRRIREQRQRAQRLRPPNEIKGLEACSEGNRRHYLRFVWLNLFFSKGDAESSDLGRCSDKTRRALFAVKRTGSNSSVIWSSRVGRG